MKTILVSSEHENATLAACLREKLKLSWTEAKNLCIRGKISIEGRLQLDPATRLKKGNQIEINLQAKAPLSSSQKKAVDTIVFEDAQLIVINKPAGISSVPYEKEDIDTAMDLVREAWRAQGRKATTIPLHIVHRIDKDTSGLLIFAKTKTAEIALQNQLRDHSMERKYICVAHGRVLDARIESYLIQDRWDGLRGSARTALQKKQGKKAITWVRALEFLPQATLCEVQLETGKTHQIRIHLSEKGHPLVGETVYIRDFTKDGNEVLPCSRLLLHAKTIGFIHPTTQENLFFEKEPPPDFMRELNKLRKLHLKENS